MPAIGAKELMGNAPAPLEGTRDPARAKEEKGGDDAGKKEAVETRIGRLRKEADGLAEESKFVQAAEKYMEITKLDEKDALAWMRGGNCYEAVGDKNKALECYRIAVKLQADNREAWEYKGKIESMLGDTIAAIKSFEKVVEIDSSFAAGWNVLGELRSSVNDNHPALEAFKKATELEPGSKLFEKNLQEAIVKECEQEIAAQRKEFTEAKKQFEGASDDSARRAALNSASDYAREILRSNIEDSYGQAWTRLPTNTIERIERECDAYDQEVRTWVAGRMQEYFERNKENVDALKSISKFIASDMADRPTAYYGRIEGFVASPQTLVEWLATRVKRNNSYGRDRILQEIREIDPCYPLQEARTERERFLEALPKELAQGILVLEACSLGLTLGEIKLFGYGNLLRKREEDEGIESVRQIQESILDIMKGKRGELVSAVAGELKRRAVYGASGEEKLSESAVRIVNNFLGNGEMVQKPGGKLDEVETAALIKSICQEVPLFKISGREMTLKQIVDEQYFGSQHEGGPGIEFLKPEQFRETGKEHIAFYDPNKKTMFFEGRMEDAFCDLSNVLTTYIHEYAHYRSHTIHEYGGNGFESKVASEGIASYAEFTVMNALDKEYNGVGFGVLALEATLSKYGGIFAKTSEYFEGALILDYLSQNTPREQFQNEILPEISQAANGDVKLADLIQKYVSGSPQLKSPFGLEAITPTTGDFDRIRKEKEKDKQYTELAAAYSPFLAREFKNARTEWMNNVGDTATQDFLDKWSWMEDRDNVRVSLELNHALLSRWVSYCESLKKEGRFSAKESFKLYAMQRDLEDVAEGLKTVPPREKLEPVVLNIHVVDLEQKMDAAFVALDKARSLGLKYITKQIEDRLAPIADPSQITFGVAGFGVRNGRVWNEVALVKTIYSADTSQWLGLLKEEEANYHANLDGYRGKDLESFKKYMNIEPVEHDIVVLERSTPGPLSPSPSITLFPASL